MTEPVPGIVRVKTPRSVVPAARTHTPSNPTLSLLPLLVPSAIAAAALIGKLFRRKAAPEATALIEVRIEAIAVIFSRSEE